MTHKLTITTILAAALALSACGQSGESASTYKGDELLANGLTIKQMIESRQHNLKDLGGAFKTINDQLRQEQPLGQEIKFAAAEVQRHSQDIASWFPEGTGPDSGVETDALPEIWTQPQEYADTIEKFKTAAATLNTAAQAGDIDGVKASVRPVGGACKSCHDNFRVDD